MIESIPNNYQNKGMIDNTIVQFKRGLDLTHQIEEKINKIKIIISNWWKLKPMNYGKKKNQKIRMTNELQCPKNE